MILDADRWLSWSLSSVPAVLIAGDFVQRILLLFFGQFAQGSGSYGQHVVHHYTGQHRVGNALSEPDRFYLQNINQAELVK